MDDARLKVLVMMLVAVLALTIGEIFLAKGMKQIGRESGDVLPRVWRSSRADGSGRRPPC